MKNLYRRYKISQLLDEPLLDKEKEIIEFIIDKIKDLTIVDIDNHFFEFVNSKDIVIFLLDDEYNISWFNSGFFWDVLETKYLLSYDNIQEITKDVVESIYKMNIGKPYSDKDNIDK
jgi:hypothetical protein